MPESSVHASPAWEEERKRATIAVFPPEGIHMNSFGSRSTLTVGDSKFDYFSLEAAEKAGAGDISKMPFSLKVMLENLLRFEDGSTVSKDDVLAVARSASSPPEDKEIAFRPARVLMQDFTGVPAVVDLATMRDVIKRMGGD